MVQFVKVFSLAISLGLSLIPGLHQPAPSRHLTTSSPNASSQERPAGSIRLDGGTVADWTAAQRAFQAQIDAEQAKEAADAAAAAAAAKAAADAAAAARQAAARPATTAPARSADPGKAAVQDLIRQAFGPQGQAAVDWGLRVAACESGYNPNAYNAGSGASGVFQFMPGTFRGTPYGNQNIFDATANVDAAAWYYQQHGGGAWSCK